VWCDANPWYGFCAGLIDHTWTDEYPCGCIGVGRCGRLGQCSCRVVGSAQFRRERLQLGKALLGLTFAATVAAVFVTAEGQQAVAQITTATVDQYLTQASHDASTTSQSFRESRSGEPETLATPDTTSDTSVSTADTPSASESGAIEETTAVSLGASANVRGKGEASVRQAANLSSLPETGGPDSATLLWGVIALVSLVSCLGIMRAAYRDDRC
jgi:cobalamin biosynthesis Mg chelatase CobN